MRSRAIAVAAFAILVAVFVVDALTQQALVIAIVLDVPIVLAALTRSRRLTVTLVVTAIAADVVAALIDAARDGYRWDPVGLEDRGLSLLSIVLVGFLSTAVQERAERVGRLAAQEARARREATLAAVAERVRSSLSFAVVLRAIVREAAALFGGDAAWYPSAPGAELLAFRADEPGVIVVASRPPPEIASLVQRVADERTVTAVRSADPIGRFALGRLEAASALAIPLVDAERTYGVLTVTLARDADDALVGLARGFAAVAVDALAQARLFDELAERNEALNERQAVIRDLVYALSHDLRTPLAALSMTLRQAADGAFGALPSPYAAVLRDSRVAVDDLQRLAETLLVVARFEAGEARTEREPVDLDAVASEVVSEMGSMAEARGVRLVAATDGAARTRGSRPDLRRAIVNLTANALQHTPAGGTVTVRTRRDGSAVRAIVEDDGFGVAPERRRELFGRFATGAASGSGTGLGLYIVRRIAEESGGHVGYAPRDPRGSIFTLTLPALAS